MVILIINSVDNAVTIDSTPSINASSTAINTTTAENKLVMQLLLGVGSNSNADVHLEKLKTWLEHIGTVTLTSKMLANPDRRGIGPDFVNVVMMVTLASPQPYRKIVKQLKDMETRCGRQHRNAIHVPLDVDVLAVKSDNEIDWRFIPARLPLQSYETICLTDLKVSLPN